MIREFLFPGIRLVDYSLLLELRLVPIHAARISQRVLADAAVIGIAVHAGSRPVSAKALAGRHHLPPRRFEPVLQALVRDGILLGIHWPHGRYTLARQRHITVEDIMRAVGSVEVENEPAPAGINTAQ